jgi:hypothetical protein
MLGTGIRMTARELLFYGVRSRRFAVVGIGVAAYLTRWDGARSLCLSILASDFVGVV